MHAVIDMPIADPRTCSESQLLERCQDVAQRCGWAAVHFGGNLHKRAWYDATGFPDLQLLHPTGLIWFRELKSETGKLTIAQQRWRDLLIDAGQIYDVWRPHDWPDIVQALSFGKASVV